MKGWAIFSSPLILFHPVFSWNFSFTRSLLFQAHFLSPIFTFSSTVSSLWKYQHSGSQSDHWLKDVSLFWCPIEIFKFLSVHMPLQPPGYSVSLFLLPDTSRRDGIRERRRFYGLPIPCSSPEKLERHHPKPVGCTHDQSRSQRHSLNPMWNSGTQADSICFLDCRTRCHGNGGSCLQSCWKDRADFIMSALTPSLWWLNPLVEALCSLGTREDPPRLRGQEQVKG